MVKKLKYTLIVKVLCMFFILIVISASCKDQLEPDPISQPDPQDSLDIGFKSGVNLSDWFLANSAQQIFKNAYTIKDFENIKSLGIDVIRLPIRFHAMTGPAPDYTLPDIFFEKLDYAIDLAEEVGINIILDFHSYFGGTPFPQSYGEEQTTKAWEQVARHCKNRSMLVYYELMNEPDGGFMKTNWPEMQGRILKAVRAIDSKHTIIVGGTDANSYRTLKDLPDYGDDNLIYTFHLYDPHLFTHQGQDWSTPSWKDIKNVPFPSDAGPIPPCPPSLIDETDGWFNVPQLFNDYWKMGTIAAVKNSIDEAIDFAKSRNVRLFCGEFGVLMTNVDNVYRCNYYETVREYFEENNIAWTMWDYRNSFGLFVKGSRYNFETDLNVPLLKALDFKVPPSYTDESGDPMQHPFIIYDDDPQGYNASFHAWPSDHFWAHCDFPTNVQHSGANCIEWSPAVKGDNVWEDFRFEWWDSDRNGGIDLSQEANSDYSLLFYFKSSSTVELTSFYARFENYTPDAGQAKAKYDFPSEQLICDGTWHEVSVPLDSFLENTMDGTFTWEYINALRFIKEDVSSISGEVFYIDDISLTKITSTGLTAINAASKLTVYMLGNEAQINMGSKGGNVAIYNINGQQVKNFGYLEAESRTIWNKAGDNGSPLPAGIYLCQNQNTKDIYNFSLK